jgi:hypothetical protein
MNKLNWTLLFFFLSLSLAGQRTSDYGIFAGTSSYMGDINPVRLLYSPRPAGGIFYRYNLHPRQSLRANLYLGGLKASDIDFGNNFQKTRAASFSGFVGELAFQFEFNFLPFTTQEKNWDYTPYIAAGAGMTFCDTRSAGNSGVVYYSGFQPVIPLTFGFKVNIHKNMGLEAEYGFRKTFYDNFDGQKDLIDPSDFSWIHNNDWYSFCGIALTWKIYGKLAGCPAYNDADIKRKRR